MIEISTLGINSAVEFFGSFTRLTRFLCLSLLAIVVLPSAVVETPKANITSSDMMTGKHSYHKEGDVQLESYTSNYCFYGGGCGSGVSFVTPSCNKGTYVYQVNG